MNAFKQIFGRSKNVVIGMIHVQALPGAPLNSYSMTKIKERAVWEAEQYLDAGVDGIMVENMHDLPYSNGTNIGYETIASMASICTSIRENFGNTPLGVQILKAGNLQALAVAKASGCNFIRTEGFVFSHISDAGWVDGCAGKLLRYRKQLDCENILIFTDVKKKHSSHTITGDTDIVSTGLAAEFFLSDGIIVTGSETGKEANDKEVNELSSKLKIPVIVGSGVTLANLKKFLDANALIVGSYFKTGELWSNNLEAEKIKTFMKKIQMLRSN